MASIVGYTLFNIYLKTYKSKEKKNVFLPHNNKLKHLHNIEQLINYNYKSENYKLIISN